MQKFNDPCIKTGDFAKLCGTNKRTLIHYDEIGIFKPAYTDERGYRYYSENQFDVFFTINCLSKLGMPLKEIGAFLNHRNPQALKKLLLEQREEVLKHVRLSKRSLLLFLSRKSWKATRPGAARNIFSRNIHRKNI